MERGELRRQGRLVGLRAWLWVRFVLSSQLILEEGSTTSELWPVTWARVARGGIPPTSRAPSSSNLLTSSPENSLKSINFLSAAFRTLASNRAEIYFVNNNNGFNPFTLCSAMSPTSAPSQPPLNEAYDQPSNPINKNPSEANSSHLLLGPNVETRNAQDVTVEATPTALGYGVRDSSRDRRDEVRAKC